MGFIFVDYSANFGFKSKRKLDDAVCNLTSLRSSA